MLKSWRAGVRMPDMAVDVGTGTTRLSYGPRVRPLERPSTMTAGEVAQRRWLRRPRPGNANAVVPALRAGVVVDAEAAAVVVSTLMRRARGIGLRRPRVLACAPTDVSEAERSALIRAIRLAGGVPVQIAPEPLAAAIGAGIDVAAADACMVIDIGDGVTDVAVIRRGRLVHTGAVRIACSDLHAAIQAMVQARYGTVLSVASCARLTRIVGAVYPRALPVRLPVPIETAGGEESEVVVETDALWRAIDPVFGRIVGHILAMLRALPDPCYRQVAAAGLCLTGGGALVRGINDRVLAATRIHARVADYPLQAVITGATRIVAAGSAAATLLPENAAVDAG